MAALNGKPMNGRPMNGSSVAPSSALPDGSGSHAIRMRAINDHPARAHSEEPAPSPAADTWSDPPLDDLERERARLEGEIAAARARTAAAKDRAITRDAEVRAALRADLVASRESLVEIERQYDESIAEVRGAAQADVERILAEARRQVARHTGGAAGSEQKRVNHVE